MKKLALLVVLAAMASISARAADGTIDFRNRITGTIDVAVTDATQAGAKALGPDLVAQLFFSSTQGGTYTAVSAAPAAFRTGTGAGYWNAGTDSTRTLTGINAGDAAWLIVKVWDSTKGASMEAARDAGGRFGQSTAFSVVTGGAGVPPGPPAAMVGMATFAVDVVPEPATLALLGLGAAALILRRRK